MQNKTKERIDFIKANPQMDRAEMAKVLDMQSAYLTTFARAHNLVLKTTRELLVDFIKANPTLNGQQIADEYLMKTGEDHCPTYICSLAREIGVFIRPNTTVAKPVKDKPEPSVLARIEMEKKIKSPDYEKPRKERCPAVYTQSSSPYGYAEKLGVTVKTVKR